LLNAWKTLEIARSARDIFGANGMSLGYATIRHILDLQTANTCEGTEDIHILSIGRDITGMDAFSCEPTTGQRSAAGSQ